MEILQKIADGRTDLILEYLKSSNSTKETVNGHSLLSIAAYYGDVTAIKVLLENGAHLTNLGPNLDLNGAAFHGHWQLCQYLLESGADPNFTHHISGETPLHSCLSKSNQRSRYYIVRLLLEYGANPNLTTQAGAPTDAFMRDAHVYGETALHRAAAFSAPEIIELLIQYGARKEMKDCNGASPLSWASWHCRPGAVLSLLTFEKHNLHPEHIYRIQGDHGYGYGASMMYGLLGKVHL